METAQSSPKPILAVLGGTGKEGPGLAMRWAYAGYKVLIGSRSAEKAQATAASLNEALGIDTVEGLDNAAAARQAEICILTVVAAAQRQALEGLVADLQGKILVDATARIDFRNVHPPEPPSAARTAQEILGPGVRVVAAFQNVPAHALKQNLGGIIETDVLVCADDKAAAEAVIELAKGAGMRAFYAGGLNNAVVVEGLTALLISINKHYGLRTASIAVTGLGEPPA